MATIGLSIESGAVQAILFDPVSGKIVASNAADLRDGVEAAMPAAVEAMRTAAKQQTVGIDAVGIAYRSKDEREKLKSAAENCNLDGVAMVPTNTAVLTWLSRSAEFADARRVLLYVIGASGVTLSLADADKEELSTPKTATLNSMSPEHIGSTVPLAWEVLDAAGVKADSVALFGDGSSNRDVVDILALGLGIPVIRVEKSDEIAARGAGVLAARSAAVVVAPVDLEKKDAAPLVAAPVVAATPVVVAPTVVTSTAEPVLAPSPTPTPKVRPVATSTPAFASLLSTVPAANITLAGMSTRRGIPRKKLVLAAALLALVLSGGVALAATLPSDAPARSDTGRVSVAEAPVTEPSLTGGVLPVEMTSPPPAPVLEPAPPVLIDPTTGQPVTTTSSAEQWTINPTTGAPWPAEVLTPIPAAAIPPAAAVVPRSATPPPTPTVVAHPKFAVPTIIPEPGKSQQQLEDEAWARHWQQTAQWVGQEIAQN